VGGLEAAEGEVAEELAPPPAVAVGGVAVAAAAGLHGQVAPG